MLFRAVSSSLGGLGAGVRESSIVGLSPWRHQRVKSVFGVWPMAVILKGRSEIFIAVASRRGFEGASDFRSWTILDRDCCPDLATHELQPGRIYFKVGT
jgi:hypothetical protein